MKILMLSSTFPYPPSRGGTQVRTFNLLKYLSKKHSITLLVQKNQDVSETEISQLRQYVNELVVFPRPIPSKNGFLGKVKRFAHFCLKTTPPNVLSIYSPQMQGWIDRAVAENEFKIVTCEHSVNQIYIRPQWQKQLTTIANIHSSVYQTCKNQLETKTSENPWRDRLYLPLLRRYEASFINKFSRLIVTTKEDKKQFLALNSKIKISIVSNGVDLDIFPYRKVDPGGYDLIITGGMDYLVNIDAACFFSLKIFPLVRAKYPQTSLTIVGSQPDPAVLALAENPGITVTGRVPSMAKYLHRATVCIVPMRAGFGIKNKTLEAMAAGTPVVGSDRGLEGLEVDDSDVPLSALRANKIEEYISAISRLFESIQLRNQLSINARNLIEKKYTWNRVGLNYERAILNNN